MSDWRDWKDDKDLGPDSWNFIEQFDKPFYNEGSHISPNTEPVWDLDRVIPNDPVTEPHNPWCGYWVKDPQEPEPYIRVTFPSGEWKAALEHPDNKHIYVFDKDYSAVIKINTAIQPPVVVDRLVINTDTNKRIYYDVNHGLPGSQKGSYCINADGTRLWYLFHRLNADPVFDLMLVEVDISDEGKTLGVGPDGKPVSYMEIVKTTTLTGAGVVDANTSVTDCCVMGDYTYWAMNSLTGRIIKVRNSDHVVIENKLFNYDQETYTGLEEPIGVIDTDGTNLYWSWTQGGGPNDFARQKHVKADGDLNELSTITRIGNYGWPTQLKIGPDGLPYMYNSYHPSVGQMAQFTSGFVETSDIQGTDYCTNILGFSNSEVFYFCHENDVIDIQSYLVKARYSGGLDIDPDPNLETNPDFQEASFYTGFRWLADDQDWSWKFSSTGAYNNNTKKIMMFTYRSSPSTKYPPDYNNWGATWDDDFNILSHVAMDTYLVDITRGAREDETIITT